MSNYYIWGAGGHGLVINSFFTQPGLISVTWVDDKPMKGWSIFPDDIPVDVSVLLGIGNNAGREDI